MSRAPLCERRDVTVSLTWDTNDFDIAFDQWVKQSFARIRDVPRERRHEIRIQYNAGSSGPYGDSSSLRLVWTRPETDEELAKRQADSDRYHRQSEERERGQLSYLKQKYPHF